MKKLLLLFALVTFAGSHGQSLWREASNAKLAPLAKLDRASTPLEGKIFTLNLEALKSQLELAPTRESGIASTVIIPFPTSDGSIAHFRVYEASVMHPELAAKYPDIKSYVGQGIEQPTATIRFSTTLFGLHTMLFNENGVSYIDPYTADLQNYIVYDKEDLTTDRVFECHSGGQVVDETAGRSTAESFASDGLFRVYRLAMASTVEYSAFHVNAAGLNSGTTAQKKAAVLAAMNVTMTRVNGIYERDMSLTMQLVPNNDLIIFIGIDSFNNTNAQVLIDQSQTVIDANIGAANYDIGHTVSTGGGGLAQLNAPCTANKARGITGSSSPVGDPFDIDYVTHEMGHQFGATHTFNNSCDGNVQPNTAFEPGSGTTIMAYAGICSPDIQSNSSPHFHAISIAQMSAFVAGTGSCAQTTPNGNFAPIVNAGGSYTIPHSTPFVLRGSATDANGDNLTYSWEQMNNESTVQPPSSTSTSGPNFVSQIPSSSPNRYMPSLQSQANNVSPTWEVLPSVARTMNFRLTVRDNRMPNGGQTGYADMTVNSASTGPFRVTSQNTAGQSWTQNSQQNIVWDVAGTTGNGINVALVNILLSSDGGLTYPTVLAANTPNDGNEMITVPNIAAPFNRIMVEAVGNIFYAINGQPIAIGYTVTNTCQTYTNTTPLVIPDGLGNNVAGPAVSSTITVPDNSTITDVNVTVNGTHTYFWDLIVTAVHPDGTQARLLNRICNNISTGFNIEFDDAAPAIVCGPTVVGSYSPNQPLSAFNTKMSGGTWTLTANDNYGGDVGTINSWSLEICTQTIQLATAEVGLAEFAIYPNPNNGAFNVAFTSTSGNEVTIGVHDIRGRSIYQKNFANQGMFAESISLDNAESGIYLVTVSDGERKEVRKIVIN